MGSRRIMREFRKLQETNFEVEGIIIRPEDNIYRWTAIIPGPSYSCYARGNYHLEIAIPTDYPFKPPAIIFLTKIYHPNIDQYGKICLQILYDGWSPQYSIANILIAIKNMLTDPNPESYHLINKEVVRLTNLTVLNTN